MDNKLDELEARIEAIEAKQAERFPMILSILNSMKVKLLLIALLLFASNGWGDDSMIPLSDYLEKNN